MKLHRSIRSIATLSAAALVLALVPAAHAQTPQAPLAGIAHVALRVHDLNASRAFYQKLGFASPFNLKHDDGIVYESFIKINDAQFLELYPVTAKDTQIGFLHLCFEGADLNTLQKSYVEEGLPPTDVRKAGAGNLLFTLAGPIQPAGPQNIEYTQYQPGSLHSNDKGKDLGADRVATQLTSVTLAMKDTGEARDFYANKLGFVSPDPAKIMILALPGTSGQQVEITRADFGFKAGITLTSNNLGKSAKHLKKEQVAFRRTDAGLTLKDPDGNEILIKQAEKPDLLDPITKLLP
jgi:catechol 2,3-dioxygenase-like lactoylglutathione lyase family enzyme